MSRIWIGEEREYTRGQAELCVFLWGAHTGWEARATQRGLEQVPDLI